MAVFTLDLTDDLRAKLEDHRKRLGARSLADTIRSLIGASENAQVWEDIHHQAHATGAEAAMAFKRAEMSRGFPGKPMVETNETVERPPVGTRKRVMSRDPKSAAPMAIWHRLVRYDGDMPIWKPE